LWIEGDEQRIQEVALLKERRQALSEELKQNAARIERWHRWLRLERLIAEARPQILYPDYVRLIKGLDKELAERERAGGIEGVKRELDRDAERMDILEKDVSRCDERISALEARTDVAAGRPSVHLPEAQRLFTRSGKISSILINKNINLSLAIANRVSQSDLLLVIAETFSMYRKWVEFEFEIASFSSRRIPKIGVIPPGRSELPRELQHRCDHAVRWEPDAIVAAVLSHAPPLGFGEDATG
jgi:hypothetical protein